MKNVDRMKADQKTREMRRELQVVAEENAILRKELVAKNSITCSEYVIRPFDGIVQESTAFALASDWHIEETVRSETVNGLNAYNLGIARRRAEHFFRVVHRLIAMERRNTPIYNLVLWLGGDFVTGAIHVENLETCSLRPVQAINRVLEMLVSGIAFLLKEDPDLNIIIPTSIGNHSRVTQRVHSATELGNSLELFLYQAIAQRFGNEPRVKVIISDSYHTYVTVYGKVFRFHHGHAVKYGGGVGGLTIPMNKAIAQWDKGRVADITCSGFQKWLE